MNWSRFIRTFTSLSRGRSPGQLVIQMTDRCNASCPQCGMRAARPYKRSELGEDRIRRIIDTAAENGVTSISFTGGEPFLCEEKLIRCIQYAGKAGITYIRTGTNGFMFRYTDKRTYGTRVRRIIDALAATELRNIWISIDSAVPEVHERMRGLPDVIRGIEKAIPYFHRAGLYPSANLGINRNINGDATGRLAPGSYENEHMYMKHFRSEFRKGFRTFYRFVISMGFSIVNVCYPISIGSAEHSLKCVYNANSDNRLVNFTPLEKQTVYTVLREIIPEFRPYIRIFTPLSSLYSLAGQNNPDANGCYACRGGIDYFYINARDGKTYPCGYRGNEDLGMYEDLDLGALRRKPSCKECDWECFRDPSGLFGPLRDVFSNPVGSVWNMLMGKELYKNWLSDLRYYRDCSYFNGRIPPDYRKMERHWKPVISSVYSPQVNRIAARQETSSGE